LKRTAQGQYRTSNWEATYLAAGSVFAAIGLMSLALAIAAAWYFDRSAQDFAGPAERPLTHYAAGAALLLSAVSFALYAFSRRLRRHF
jgi:divalent metal cation (Fe/Co/Zn/Cd) transporter